MGSNPLNLALRFILEVCVLIAVGYWGWTQNEGMMRILLVVGAPLALAGLWVTFAVPDDPSRSGHAPIPVPGLIRLILELLIFAAGVVALLASGQDTLGIIFAGVVIFHYVISYDRILWLLHQ